MAASVLRPPPLGARQHQYPLRNTPPSISFDEMEPDGTNSPAVIDPSDPTHARGRRLSFSSSAVRRAPTNSASTTRAQAASGAFLASTTSSRGNISIDDVRSELGSVTNQLELVQRRALARRVSTMPAASHGYSLRLSGAVDTIASTTMPERAHGDQNLFRGAHAQHAPARACSSGGTVSSPPVLSAALVLGPLGASRCSSRGRGGRVASVGDALRRHHLRGRAQRRPDQRAGRRHHVRLLRLTAMEAVNFNAAVLAIPGESGRETHR